MADFNHQNGHIKPTIMKYDEMYNWIFIGYQCDMMGYNATYSQQYKGVSE